MPAVVGPRIAAVQREPQSRTALAQPPHERARNQRRLSRQVNGWPGSMASVPRHIRCRGTCVIEPRHQKSLPLSLAAHMYHVYAVGQTQQRAIPKRYSGQSVSRRTYRNSRRRLRRQTDGDRWVRVMPTRFAPHGLPPRAKRKTRTRRQADFHKRALESFGPVADVDIRRRATDGQESGALCVNRSARRTKRREPVGSRLERALEARAGHRQQSPVWNTGRPPLQTTSEPRDVTVRPAADARQLQHGAGPEPRELLAHTPRVPSLPGRRSLVTGGPLPGSDHPR